MKGRGSLQGQRVALALLVFVLIYQIGVPLFMVVWTSFKVARPGEPAFFTFTFSLDNYIRAFGSRAFWSATWNTFRFALASVALSFTLGTFLAWVVDRTNTPLARLVGILTIGRIIIPGILITISWILMASPSIGLLNFFLESLTGTKGLLNIYSFWGMVWIQYADA
jgi:iron(III) transport system permease protein